MRIVLLKALLLFTCSLACTLVRAQTTASPTKSRLLIPHQYDDALLFGREGLTAVKKLDRWGFIDHHGTVKIKFEWDEVRYFLKGSAAVRRGSSWYFIDTSGKIRTPALEKANAVDGFMKGQLNGKWGAYHDDFTVAIPFIHDFFYILDEQFIQVESSNEEESKGILTWAGDTLISADKVSIQYTDGIFLVMNRAGEGAYFDTKGNSLCSYKPGLVYTNPFKDGVTSACESSDCFILDKKIQTIASGFFSLGDVNEGQIVAAAVGLGLNRFGVYDYQSKKWSIQPKYLEVRVVDRDLYSCNSADSIYLVDRRGTILARLQAETALRMAGSSVIVRNEDYKEGCYSLEHKKLLPMVYSKVKINEDGKLILAEDASGYAVFNDKMECLASGLKCGPYPYIVENKLQVKDANGKIGFLHFE